MDPTLPRNVFLEVARAGSARNPGEILMLSFPMILVLDSRSTFMAGVLALLLFLAAGAFSAVPIGIFGVCLISLALGTRTKSSFALYSSGILVALVISGGLGLLFGDSASASIVMIPFIAVLVFLYASVAFFVGRLAVRGWHRVTGHSTRPR
jgi:hypothetical protein